jgi:pantoate--beta-alanine ligase
MAICLLGLGSNLGDRVANLLRAVAALSSRPDIAVRRISSFHETEPVGGPAGQGKFLNAAALVETALSPAELLQTLAGIEQRMGRDRHEIWGPRTIDLDLLLYEQVVVETPQVVVPHPRMHERRFVLAPAAEIAPELVHPILELTVAELLSRLPPIQSEAMGLRVFTRVAAMRAHVLELRQSGRRLGLVPTMGALHAGHLSLVRAARDECDAVVATIFVNPTQFAPHEDFAKYPRTLESDLQALSTAGCDLVFVPEEGEMYPPGSTTMIEPPAVAEPLEGVGRPGHFRGVATVVLKLFNVIPAQAAFFGQKDYQQTRVVRDMVRDLHLPVEIIVCPTVREPDGLALSSRNRYLSPAERQQALALSRALAEVQGMVRARERDAAKLRSAMRNILAAAGIERIDYATVADRETLAELDQIDRPAVALIACHVGTTRLIDNCLLS